MSHGRESTARPETSCRKKRCKMSIANKTILAFDIRVKEPRHHDTVVSRSREIQYRFAWERGDSCDSFWIFFSVRNLCYSGQIFLTVFSKCFFRQKIQIWMKISRSKQTLETLNLFYKQYLIIHNLININNMGH